MFTEADGRRSSAESAIRKATAMREARAVMDERAGQREKLEELDRVVAQAVEIARNLGCTWSVIASASGISRQAAQKRWGRLPAADPFDPDQMEMWA